MAKPRRRRKRRPRSRPRNPKPCAKTQTDTKCLAKKRVDKRGTPKASGTIKPAAAAASAIRRMCRQPSSASWPRRTPLSARRIGRSRRDANLSEDTLHAPLRESRARLGLIRMNARIGSNVAKKALDGSSEHEKFWLARRGGQHGPSKQELSTPPGQPLEFRNLSEKIFRASRA
jgi:hypothetical protein